MNQTHYLRCWLPPGYLEISYPVSRAAEVEDVADQIRKAYVDAEVDLLPGIGLSKQPDSDDNLLSIALDADRWAIVHYQDFSQGLTRSDRPMDGTTRGVQFSDVLEIPGGSFVGKQDALDAVESWLVDGRLPSTLPMTDDLFTC